MSEVRECRQRKANTTKQKQKKAPFLPHLAAVHVLQDVLIVINQRQPVLGVDEVRVVLAKVSDIVRQCGRECRKESDRGQL